LALLSLLSVGAAADIVDGAHIAFFRVVIAIEICGAGLCLCNLPCSVAFDEFESLAIRAGRETIIAFTVKTTLFAASFRRRSASICIAPHLRVVRAHLTIRLARITFAPLGVATCFAARR
jgi:hypothetical protein